MSTADPKTGKGAPAAAPPDKVWSPQGLPFAPGLLAIQENPPGPLPRAVLYGVSGLFAALLIWSLVGRIDIIAVAGGRLIPQSYVQIVQPAKAGVVQSILVTEGARVAKGQILMRLNAKDLAVDRHVLAQEVAAASLQRRRIQAELDDKPLRRHATDPGSLFDAAKAQYEAERAAYEARLDMAQAAYSRARRAAAAGKQTLRKLSELTPLAKTEATAYAALGDGGYVSRMQVLSKERAYLEDAQDLRAERQTVASLEAGVREAAARLTSTRARYRARLETERLAADARYRRLAGRLSKLRHRMRELSLRAPEAGTVMTLATHSLGTVVAPGTVLVTIVPDHEPLLARVNIKNRDVGFVHPGQSVRVKVAAYPFEKYGAVKGVVTYVSADASRPTRSRPMRGVSGRTYKALVALQQQTLIAQGKRYPLVPGMQVVADLHEGRRTVMGYLLSPIATTLRNSGR